MRRLRAVIREASATAISQPVASAVALAMVAGMVGTVLLTTGRTVGAEEAVLTSIDSAGTRSIVVRAEPGAGLDSSIIYRIANLEGISWSGAFSPARDMVNAAVPDGKRVPTRLLWSSSLEALEIPPAFDPGGVAWASSSALDQLGMQEAAGAIQSPSGGEFAVAGSLPVPDFLKFLEPLVVVPQPLSAEGDISVLVVVAARPDLVAPVAAAVQSLLDAEDPSKVSISTSEDLATLRALVEGQLGTFGRNLMIVVFAVTGVLVAAILYALVILRRKDFGRRRALGATQALIVSLLLVQMTMISMVGAAIGVAIAFLTLVVGRDPVPGASFTLGVAILAVAVSLVAALLPAFVAARRDPLTELRVP